MRFTKNTVLVPLDFSEHSDMALTMATEIALKWKASVILLHVIDMPDYKGMDDKLINHFKEEARYFAQTKMDEWVARGTMPIKQVKCEVVIGNAGSKVVEFANKEQVSLILLGSKKYENADEMLAGSAMERILRYANCPVLTIKEYKKIEEIKNIVFATDFKPTHTFITKQLKRLQEITGATIHILKVNTKDSWMSDAAIENEMREYNEIHNFTDFHFHVANSESVELGILHYYEFIYADMIAMSIHSLIHEKVRFNNYYITERVLQNMPALLWTCIQ
ncbi:MAG TPA: universal stress protein [Fulvivirga sp.]|nr:universal stress protein [Fulvivirga sp.]